MRFLAFIKFTASFISSFGIPARMATLRACKFICPRWIPSIERALKAAKFYASPTDTIIPANSCALGKPRILKVFIYEGLDLIAPP